MMSDTLRERRGLVSWAQMDRSPFRHLHMSIHSSYSSFVLKRNQRIQNGEVKLWIQIPNTKYNIYALY